MHSYYTFIALDIAQRRAAEADAWRLASLAHPPASRTLGVRRLVARFALAIARAADEDLGRISLSTR